ncbi:MAG: hypothetical protein R3C16_10825 [Hyphomonadaceae bacterium]
MTGAPPAGVDFGTRIGVLQAMQMSRSVSAGGGPLGLAGAGAAATVGGSRRRGPMFDHAA